METEILETSTKEAFSKDRNNDITFGKPSVAVNTPILKEKGIGISLKSKDKKTPVKISKNKIGILKKLFEGQNSEVQKRRHSNNTLTFFNQDSNETNSNDKSDRQGTEKF